MEYTYTDISKITQDDASGGAFYPGLWEPFLDRHQQFYDRLFKKAAAKFLRLDLNSSRNAFMLFRVTKVFSQDRLPESLKSVLRATNVSAVHHTPKHHHHLLA